MIILGCDPGLSGALALLSDSGSTALLDMPTVSVKRNGKAKRDIDYRGLGDILYKLTPGKAYVEKVGTRPGQGVSSQGAFMKATGAVLGALGALGWDIEEVPPQTWKRALGLTGKEKDSARLLAIELFPKSAKDLARKKDGGRGDAACIAYWARENRN